MPVSVSYNTDTTVTRYVVLDEEEAYYRAFILQHTARYHGLLLFYTIIYANGGGCAV